MHVKVKNKKAIIEFEQGSDQVAHITIIDEMVHLVQNHFKDFVFDFSHLDMSFNSTICGFLLAAVKKLVENGATVTFNNILQQDLDTLKLIGIDQVVGPINYVMRS